MEDKIYDIYTDFVEVFDNWFLRFEKKYKDHYSNGINLYQFSLWPRRLIILIFPLYLIWWLIAKPIVYVVGMVIFRRLGGIGHSGPGNLPDDRSSQGHCACVEFR